MPPSTAGLSAFDASFLRIEKSGGGPVAFPDDAYYLHVGCLQRIAEAVERIADAVEAKSAPQPAAAAAVPPVPPPASPQFAWPKPSGVYEARIAGRVRKAFSRAADRHFRGKADCGPGDLLAFLHSLDFAEERGVGSACMEYVERARLANPLPTA